MSSKQDKKLIHTRHLLVKLHNLRGKKNQKKNYIANREKNPIIFLKSHDNKVLYQH
jgi:hypothetical protein